MNENRLLLFAGTTEGRELAQALEKCGIRCIVCVATEYGESLIEEKTSGHRILSGRLDAEQMKDLMEGEDITHVVDATHPYAAVVTANIRQAAGQAGCRYLRLLRPSEADHAEAKNWICVDSVEEAAAFLKEREGKILAATGSKELDKYTVIPDYKHRVTARILSTQESMHIASRLGFEGSNLICMQGPFSEAMNTAMLQSVGAAWMVTKESGKTGGFPEKVRAAAAAGAKLVVVGRPAQEEGYTGEEILSVLCREFAAGPVTASENVSKDTAALAADQDVSGSGRVISLIGIGMGSLSGMTREAWEECGQADVLIGARRMLEQAADQLDKPFYDAYMPADIHAFVMAHPEYRRIAVLLSGDIGFYSGARKLEKVFAGENVRRFCGISSVVYLCAALHRSWEDVKLISLHGRSQNLIAAVKSYKKVFVIVGRQHEFQEMCRQLSAYGLGDVQVYAGCRLSYPDEEVLSGTACAMQEAETGDLTAVLIENDLAAERVTHGLCDDDFTRAKVPMTKEEVRSISLAKLQLQRDSVIYDVGAGTGSVSIEMALRAVDGTVYAVEKKPEAVELIRANAQKLGAPNVRVVEGTAPEALDMLPAPTHAFIGGSSGNMRRILEILLRKNPACRIVVNAIALETLQETLDCIRSLPVADTDIAGVTISKAREVGPYHMMMGQNPVYVISFTGAADETA